jgi:hypothetical protein
MCVTTFAEFGESVDFRFDVVDGDVTANKYPFPRKGLSLITSNSARTLFSETSYTIKLV